MKAKIDLLWKISDILFLAGLAAALFLAGRVTPLLVVAGVLPIPLLLQEVRNKRYHVSIWALLTPFGIYFAYSLLAFFFFTGLEPSDPPPVNPSLEFYLIAIAMLGVGLVRGLQIRDLVSLFRGLMPWLLVACFVVLSFLMFTGIRDECRVRGLAPWPFIPALLFSTLTFVCLVGWERLTNREQWLRAGLLALSIVVSTTYTGSRGVAVAQVGVFGMLMLFGVLPSFNKSMPRWFHLIAAAIAGLVISIVIGVATECGPASRFSSTFDTVERLISKLTEAGDDSSTAPQAAPSPETVQTNDSSANVAAAQIEPSHSIAEATNDQAIGLRLAMWETSLKAIKENPIFGHGSLYLQKLIHTKYGFEHNHNQYLTWLVTGGVLQLTLGLMFIAIPWFVSNGLSTADRILLTTGVSLFWGIAMMFDSFLNLKFYTHYFCLLCGVLYALSNSMQQRAPT